MACMCCKNDVSYYFPKTSPPPTQQQLNAHGAPHTRQTEHTCGMQQECGTKRSAAAAALPDAQLAAPGRPACTNPRLLPCVQASHGET
eukprot:333374-Chlamydomonas_euryale.AAC.7